MRNTKVNWSGIVAGIILGAIIYFVIFLLVIPHWSIFP